MEKKPFLPDLKQWIAKGPSEAELPQRVRSAISKQQDQAEMMVGWIQLSVVLIFGTLYLISPKTFNEDASFEPVPWALSIYFVLTVIRLIWGHLRRLPDWSLVISICFDMGLLMVLIWSFHIQYGQPPSFYLKAPTLLYVFIFIAMRALRFESWLVMAAGGIAAAGWGTMILYVITADPLNTMITRDYVTYMTSNAILLGAEFDKIISILLVTGIMALALRRGRALLVRSVIEQQAAQRLSRFFDKGVARQIAGGEEHLVAGQGQSREAAILNLDMRGFTRLAEQRDPDEVMELLAEYQQRMVPVLQRHGGSIDKFMGDGIMATFGAAQPSQSYAADALAALCEALGEADVWSRERQERGLDTPQVNGAVTHGRIVFGAVGDENRLEITVIGDAVNLSAKLEKHNKNEGARGLALSSTYEIACQQGFAPEAEIVKLQNRQVPGVAGTTDLVKLA